MLVIFTAGCDTAVDLSDDPAGVQPSPEVGPQAASVDLSAMTSVAPDGRTYGCALSSYTGSDYEQAYQYRYAQLAFPESAIGRPAEVQRFTYRLRNENDRVLRQATCLIPKTDEARDLVLDWVSLTDVSPGLISASDVEGADTEESTFFDEDNDEVPPWECFPLPGFGLWCNEAVVEADRPTGGGGSQDDDWGNDWDPDDIFDDWDYPDQPGGPGGGDSDGDDDENCTEESEDTTPPTEGENPCGPACYDPPTDEPNDDGPGGDGPHDAPGFLTGVTWQVVTSSGLVAAPYDLVQHALMNEGCDEPSVEEQLEDLLEENPYALLDIPCDLIPDWQNVAGHEIPDAVFDRLDSEALFEDAEIQRLEDATGAIVNMDHYSVSVSEDGLPDGMDAEAYLDQVRMNINDYAEPADFQYYPGTTNEADRWANNPIGTMFSIALGPGASGSIVATDYSSSHWIFSTVYTAEDGTHPVSGNRQFGFNQHDDGSVTFYTQATDRISSNRWRAGNLVDYIPLVDGIFEGGGNVWENLQENIGDDLDFAVVADPVTFRPDYDQVQAVLDGEADISTLKECE